MSRYIEFVFNVTEAQHLDLAFRFFDEVWLECEVCSLQLDV